MPPAPSRWLVCAIFPLVLFAGECSARPACDSIETRNAVLQFVLADRNNALLAFAAKNSTASKDGPGSDSAKPLYELGQTIVTTSTSKDKLTLTCSGPLSVAAGDLKATKEVNFTVQQASDGKLSVSVEPFQF